MPQEIGRLKSGKLLRIYIKNDNFILEIGGEISQSFTNREEAVKEGKILMLKSWLPGAEKENIKNMLNSYMDIEYNFIMEWCDRQAREKPECDCGCWGYPVEIGIFGSLNKNRYKGCPKCGEDIK